ncbi:transmembrane protein 41A-A-like [Ornithodoros turicata]|uniref:transmembrane protein 41A-A-like n=1 Tax=Ornithodoros turicata TaxID=34597 RepID=UPI003138D74F
MVSIVYLPIFLALATGWLYLVTLLAPSTGGGPNSMSLKFPSSYEELKGLAELLSTYNNKHALYVLVLFTSAYLYKQTFAIPGSVFLNVLSGALFGIWRGFFLTCTLSALGASLCYMLSKICGRHHLEYYFPDRIQFLQKKVQENKHHLLFWLLFLRLFPMTPNWFLNIASPIIDVPLHLFFISVFIGLMPYNFICVQTGSILSEVKSMNDVLSWHTMGKLVMAAAVALLPSLLIKKKNLTVD